MTHPDFLLDETVSSPLGSTAPPPPQESPAGGPGAKQKGGKTKKGAAPKQQKVTRCGQCYTCKNKQLKKVTKACHLPSGFSTAG